MGSELEPRCQVRGVTTQREKTYARTSWGRKTERGVRAEREGFTGHGGRHV